MRILLPQAIEEKHLVRAFVFGSHGAARLQFEKGLGVPSYRPAKE
jgi:hypothetical protein